MKPGPDPGHECSYMSSVHVLTTWFQPALCCPEFHLLWHTQVIWMWVVTCPSHCTWHIQIIELDMHKSLNWTCPSHWMWVVTCPSHCTWHIQITELDMPKSLHWTFPSHCMWVVTCPSHCIQHIQVIKLDMPNSSKLTCPSHCTGHAPVSFFSPGLFGPSLQVQSEGFRVHCMY